MEEKIQENKSGILEVLKAEEININFLMINEPKLFSLNINDTMTLQIKLKLVKDGFGESILSHFSNYFQSDAISQFFLTRKNSLKINKLIRRFIQDDKANMISSRNLFYIKDSHSKNILED